MEQGTVPEWYYTFDGLGSVSEVTDVNQNVVEAYKYDSFGNLQTPPATGNPYTYTGREYDSESGLYYYRARYYDPQLGRFITADPIRLGGGINFYVYVENNPINKIDPFGKQSGLNCETERRKCMQNVYSNYTECVSGVPYLDIPICFVICGALCLAAGPSASVCIGACLAACSTFFGVGAMNRAVGRCKDEAERAEAKCWDNFNKCICNY